MLLSVETLVSCLVVFIDCAVMWMFLADVFQQVVLTALLAIYYHLMLCQIVNG